MRADGRDWDITGPVCWISGTAAACLPQEAMIMFASLSESCPSENWSNLSTTGALRCKASETGLTGSLYSRELGEIRGSLRLTMHVSCFNRLLVSEACLHMGLGSWKQMSTAIAIDIVACELSHLRLWRLAFLAPSSLKRCEVEPHVTLLCKVDEIQEVKSEGRTAKWALRHSGREADRLRASFFG